MNRKKFILLVVIILVVSIAIFTSLSYVTYPSEVVLGGKTFFVSVADNQKLLEKGLSGQKQFYNNEGMLFIFPKEDSYGFWMKDMLFSLDIIWFDSDYKIVGIEKSATPQSYPKIFYPQSPALYVLEISEGQANKLGLKIGDSMKFSVK